MNTQNTTDINQIETLARKRACAKIGFYKHLTIYLLVNCVLITISLWHGKPWALFPLLGWGIGLSLHGLSVWYAGHGSAWCESMINKEREQLLKQHALATKLNKHAD